MFDRALLKDWDLINVAGALITLASLRRIGRKITLDLGVRSSSEKIWR
jgi:hypothetical protein